MIWMMRLGPDSRSTPGTCPPSLERGDSPMPVQLSESAAREVKKIITEQSLPEGTVLRVGVQGGGCSGFSYSLNFDTATSARDRGIDVGGVKLAVDKKFDPCLYGTVVDFFD